MIKVLIQADSRYPVNRKRIRQVISDVLIHEGMTSDVIVSVAVVGDRKMTSLHEQYMHLPGPTDVMSFPYIDPQSNPGMKGKRFEVPTEEGLMLGDIVVSFPQVVTQAREKNILVDEEMDFLVKHAMEHLLGRHHE
jgi:probable rRNA maturation factor